MDYNECALLCWLGKEDVPHILISFTCSPYSQPKISPLFISLSEASIHLYRACKCFDFVTYVCHI